MIRKLFFLAVFFIVPYNVFAFNAGIILGNSHLYSLIAPKGWVLDNQSGRKNNLHAVFYPKGGSWDSSTAVMYANVVIKGKNQKNVKEVISNSLKDFKKHSKNKEVKVKDFETIKVGDKNIVIKKWLNHTSLNNNYELVAYIEEAKVIVLLVLTSRDKTEFNQSIDSFKELIKSYKFHSDKPTYKAVSDNKMAKLIKIANKQEKSKEGAQFTKQVIKSTVNQMTTILKKCNTKIEKMKDFDFVFVKNETAECFMKGGMLSRSFPEPPINDFHYHITMQMKIK